MAALLQPAPAPPLVLLAFEDDVVSRQIEAAIDHLTVRVAKSTVGEELLRLLGELQPDLVLVERPGSVSVAEAIRSIQAAAPAASVVMVHPAADADAVLESIRAGASDCIYPPFASEVPKAIERVLADRVGSKPALTGKVIGFLSAKGGCGATTVACHVASAVRARRSEPVLLADLDVGAGNVSFLLKSSNRHTVLDAARNIERLDTSFWKALVSVSGGVDVIGAPGPGAPSADGERLASVLHFTRSFYAWSVLDLGRGLNPLAAALLAHIDELYIVATPDPLALHQAQRLAGYLAEAAGRRPKVRLLLNRVPSRAGFPTNLEQAIGLPVAAVLRDAEAEVQRAVEDGVLVGAKTGLGQDIAVLASTLVEDAAGRLPARARPRSGSAAAQARTLIATLRAKLLRAPAKTAAEINWTSYIELSETAFRLGRTPEALLFLNKAVQELEAIGGRTELRLGRTLNRLGVMLGYAGHWAEAERSLKRAQAILVTELGEHHPEVAVCLSNLAAVFKTSGQLQSALELYQQSLAIEVGLGPDDMAAAWNLDGIAEIQGMQGQYLAALFSFRRSLAIKKQVLGDEHWDVAVTLEKIGDLYVRQSRYSEAEPLFWRSVTIRKRLLGEAAPGLANGYSRLARLYLAEKKYSAANRLFRFTLALLAGKENCDPQRIRTNLAQLAETYRGLAQFDQAIAASKLADAFLAAGEEKRRRLAATFLSELQNVPQPSAGANAHSAHAGLY